MLRCRQIRPALGRVFGLIAFAFCAIPATAQVLPLMMDRSWPGLSKDDLDRMHTAELRLFDGRSVGTIERWRNPDTDNAGKVELVRKYDAKGLPCRGVSYTIRFGGDATAERRYRLNWCRQQSGDWKIVPKGPPA